ncbi:MAG: transposase [Paenibacillus sp.]|jgi:hypothetical protein|nr:transposase [Paenibacillus sp.]
MKRHSGVRRAQLLIDLAKRTVGSKQATHAYKLHLEIKKMKSIMKLCGKLARLLVGLARSEEAYKPKKVFALAT